MHRPGLARHPPGGTRSPTQATPAACWAVAGRLQAAELTGLDQQHGGHADDQIGGHGTFPRITILAHDNPDRCRMPGLVRLRLLTRTRTDDEMDSAARELGAGLERFNHREVQLHFARNAETQ
jgi:hypothetical protein